METINQLKNFGCFSFFENIFITEAYKNKSTLILEKGLCLSKNDFMVGDTGYDISTANELGVTSISVLSGSNNRAILESYKPDFIIENISKIPDLLK